MLTLVRRVRRGLVLTMTVGLFVLNMGGCIDVLPPPDDGSSSEGYNNTTDPTNASATYVGSAACSACHSSIAQQHALHGHAHMLKTIRGEAPEYPVSADRAGVPNPPSGFDWSDVAYVIGGYSRRSLFITTEGHVLTTGHDAVSAQWNLSFPANGSTSGFVPFEEFSSEPMAYGYSCFECHTTGPIPQDANNPNLHQDNRPGILGAWQEAGVQCEACHGPGSNHVPSPSARDLFVGNDASNCGKCHTRTADASSILASDGFIASYQQWPELVASGGHAEFSCTTCHDAHNGTNYDPQIGIRNECSSCHTSHDMAIHEGVTFVRGDYTEILSCVSCHMPFASKSATFAATDVVGDFGKMGDLRTHIFRVNTLPVDQAAMFNGAGGEVAKNAQGQAAVTMDFVCFRCHNGIGNAGVIDSLELASGVADGMHAIVRPQNKGISQPTGKSVVRH